MRPGEDCLECHRAGDRDPVFTAAGTVFDSLNNGVSGATVTITDSATATHTATTSAAGNFYFTASLTPPFKVSVSKGSTTSTMPGAAENGACNSCHSAGGSSGKIRLP